MRIRSGRRRARRLAQPAARVQEPGAADPVDHLPADLPRRLRGGLSSGPQRPGFHFHGNYTAFQFVFVFLQSAAFGGVFTGFGIAADFESGFARRMLLAAPHRTGMLLGYAAAGIGRWRSPRRWSRSSPCWPA
jgi:hypothetical protein